MNMNKKKQKCKKDVFHIDVISRNGNQDNEPTEKNFSIEMFKKLAHTTMTKDEFMEKNYISRNHSARYLE